MESNDAKCVQEADELPPLKLKAVQRPRPRLAPLFAPKEERVREHRRRSEWHVYLVRHGNVASESYSAGPDAMLSGIGRQQAISLQQRLVSLVHNSAINRPGHGRVLAVTSPLRRAIDTALLSLSALPSVRMELRVIADLREVRAMPGDAGSPGAELAQSYRRDHPALATQLAALDDGVEGGIGPWWHTTTSREPLSIARRRVARVRVQLEKMAEEYCCVIVFGHATLFQMLRNHGTRMANCEVCRFCF